MRGIGALLCFLMACSLVVSGRTEDYEGACADEEEAASARYGMNGEPSAAGRAVLGIAFSCQPCASEDCIEACMAEETNSALTLECSACYADAVECGLETCDNDCDDPSDVRNCLRCLCDSGCANALNECAGLSVADCPA